MHKLNTIILTNLRLVLLLGAALSLLVSLLTPLTAKAQSTNTLSFTLSPVSGTYKPGSIIALTFGFKNTEAIAGTSAKVAYSNSSLVSFESLGESGLTFVDYNSAQKDIIAVCSDNNCPPGTYSIAKLHIKIGSNTGAPAKVTITNRESADTELGKIGASGVSASFGVSAGAAPTEPSVDENNGNTVTVPGSGGSSGVGNIPPPQQVSEEDVDDEDSDFYDENFSGGAPVQPSENGGSTSESDNNVGFSLSPLLLIGLGIFGGTILLLGGIWLKRFLGLGAPKTPPYDNIVMPPPGSPTNTNPNETIIRPTEYPPKDQQ